MDSNLKETGLVVPIDVVAFCVGEIDAQEATNGFAGATVAYDNLLPENQEALLGETVVREFSDPPWQQMEKGIHLHWALPDALTKAEEKEGSLVFPPVPNRWLVTRFIIPALGSTPQTLPVIPETKSWIVESDALLSERPEEQYSVTVPVKEVNSSDIGYRFLGCWKPFDQSWRELRQGTTLKDLTHQDLTAVSTGVVSFASYYPNSRSVFGFADSLEDISVKDKLPLQLMYVVIGWFSDSANDPLREERLLKSIEETHRWTFTGSRISPSFTVYHGIVQNIDWDPQRKYVHEQPSQQPIHAEAAIGNNPAEALSAYFRYKNHPDIPFFEKLLNAFQLDVLKDFAQPKTDQLAKLEEQLHKQEFRSLDAGLVYTVVKTEDQDDEEGKELLDLPPQLAADLNLLNVYQQQHDFYQNYLNTYRWQLFADWYRIFKANTETKDEAFRVAKSHYKTWESLQPTLQQRVKQLCEQLSNVKNQLGDTLKIKALPATRYWQPNEPVIALASQELSFPSRYGGDGQYTEEGNLVCRPDSQILTAISVDSYTIPASYFTPVALPTPNHLPYAEICSSLLQEACLLNTRLISVITKKSAEVLTSALKELLTGKPQNTYKVTGTAPSPCAVNWWDNNPWLPVFIAWEVDLLPFQATSQGNRLLNYTPDFFTANYDITPGGGIQYHPEGTPIDPSKNPFVQSYRGSTILSQKITSHLRGKISDYLKSETDATLSTILQQLQSTSILVQPLSGFNSCLLMQDQNLQLNITVSPKSSYKDITQAIAAAIEEKRGEKASPMAWVGPNFTSFFNPIRAGYLKLSLQAVDVFGQKRRVEFSQLSCADSMTSSIKEKILPSIPYLPPRLAQPSRLLFRWLAASNLNIEEMTPSPALSPVCGWLLPNHLEEGFFLYNAQGKALGEIFLNGDKTRIEWQSAPGNNQTINKSIEAVLEYQNPQLRELAIFLRHASVGVFKAFWQAVDKVHETINPLNLSTNSSMAVLIGRPVALVQASLRLEIQGNPAINQGWASISPEDYIETDNKFSEVQFPVILGDIDRINDGLIGYFKQTSGGAGYDLNTFYTQGADPSSKAGVVRPDKTTLLLTPSPQLNSSDPDALEKRGQKVLMLVDPRAQVHATMGIVPIVSLEISSDQAHEALSVLEMSFLIAPLVRASNTLTLPTPQESGYQASWVEEVKGPDGMPKWLTTPEIVTPASSGVWAYSPQTIVEGWLRFNPLLLEFMLVNSNGKPFVTKGTTNTLILNIRNKKTRGVTFKPGQLLGEGQLNKGSIFYIHFGPLVAQQDVPKLQFGAKGWSFKNFSDSKYGQYWAATPEQEASLVRDTSLLITIDNLIASVSTDQNEATIYFDYYNIDCLDDGVFKNSITLQP